jgi:hypothetical protein
MIMQQAMPSASSVHSHPHPQTPSATIAIHLDSSNNLTPSTAINQPPVRLAQEFTTMLT